MIKSVKVFTFSFSKIITFFFYFIKFKPQHKHEKWLPSDSTPWTLTLTLGLMATSIYGNYMIEEEFDPWLFLDPYSYPAAFKANKDRYFPEKGENVLLFFRYRSYITYSKGLNRWVGGP